MFESYIRGVFYYNYSSCHQLHTVALSFLPYAAGKQQLEGKMPKIGHFHFTNRSQRDKNSCKTQDIQKSLQACLQGSFYILCFIGKQEMTK